MTRTLFLVLTLGLAACSSGDDRIDTIVGLTGDAANGGAVYASNCAGCHGADGNGGTEEGILGEDDVEVVEVVLNGKESMPSFADTLSDQDIADVLAWLAEQG
jgi:ubiquinol-cytochrome c reductase cytochrome c subunit